VLILPIESILTRVEVDAIVGKYDPKTVIPAHYSLNALTTDVSGLESADEWVNDQEQQEVGQRVESRSTHKGDRGHEQEQAHGIGLGVA